MPELWVRQGLDGLEMGFDTKKQRLDRGEGEKPETAAVLPWSEFGIQQWRGGVLPLKKHLGLRRQLGWKRDRFALDPPGGSALQHKYFMVIWTEI